jgi:orotidine-5'-phosphate decarboxylase
VLCVGVDPVPERLPGGVMDSCAEVIEALSGTVAAFKFNTAFFEALGAQGWGMLESLTCQVPADTIVIIDAKRGDIGNTSARYRHALMEGLRADAVTLNPLMGLETFGPYLDASSTCVYALALTSNPGASDYLLRRMEDGRTLSETLAGDLRRLQADPSCQATLGMVVGATRPETAKPVIDAFSEAPLLIPGIGAQGGDIEAWKPLMEAHAGLPLFNSSRGILYPEDPSAAHDWIGAVRRAADLTNRSLQPILECLR